MKLSYFKNKGMVIEGKRLKILGLIMQGNIDGVPVSLRELGKVCGIRSPNGVLSHLESLRAKGLITWENGKARTLKATCRFIPSDLLAPLPPVPVELDPCKSEPSF